MSSRSDDRGGCKVVLQSPGGDSGGALSPRLSGGGDDDNKEGIDTRENF